MFASIMLILAGTMGTLFAGIEGVVSFPSCPPAPAGGTAPPCTVHELPAFLTTQTQLLQLVLSLATLVLGVVSLRARQKRFAYVGCLTGIGSLGFVGLVPILSLIAVGFLVQAHREGEDMTGTRKGFQKHEWPDKALAASLFLLVAGVLAVLQGSLILAGAYSAILGQGAAVVEGLFDLAAGGWCAYASWQIYHLRKPWTGFVAAGVAALSMGLVIIGPLLAATALVLILMAGREREFVAA